MDADRAPPGGSRAALPQRATLAVAREAGLSGLGEPGLIASRVGDRAGLLVDLEVVDGEPARHRRGKRRWFDRLGVAGGPKRRARLAGPVAGVAQHLQAGQLASEQLDPGRPVGDRGGGQRAFGDQPVSGSAAIWPL
jgi:hypothetical protein